MKGHVAPVSSCQKTGRWSVLGGKCMYSSEAEALKVYKDLIEYPLCNQMEEEQGRVDVGLYTIQATGTRFVSRFLEHIGAIYSRRHIDDPQPCFGLRRIVTVRDPIDLYLSHKGRLEPRKYTRSDLEFVSVFAEYIWNTSQMEAFYFPLDIDPQYRQQLLAECAAFCGREYAEDFLWSNDEASGCANNAEISDEMRRHLQFAVNWYSQYTVFWGTRNGN